MSAPHDNPFDCDIGVIYTHERQFMPALLTSLAESCGERRCRLLLVDNASADGADQWRTLFTPAQVIRNTARLTYAENLNRLLAHSTARYALLLNTDMWFEPAERCVAKLIDFMDDHPGCGVAGCRLRREDASDCRPARRMQTLPVVLSRRLGLSRFFPSAVERYLCLDRAPTDTFECDWLSGCLLMTRRAAWQAIDGFDAGYRKYFEDVDFCVRLRAAGWQVFYHGGTHAYHLEQRASRRLLSRDAWLHARSYLRWVSRSTLGGGARRAA